MKYEDIQAIIRDFEASTLASMELEFDNVKIKLTKNVGTAPAEPVPSVDKSTPQKAPEKPAKPEGYVVKSPLVGTFYASSAPDKEPFVHVGDTVKKGDTLCIIEAMKIMNEITAPISGKILHVHVSNGDAIGFEEELFTIKDAK